MRRILGPEPGARREPGHQPVAAEQELEHEAEELRIVGAAPHVGRAEPARVEEPAERLRLSGQPDKGVAADLGRTFRYPGAPYLLPASPWQLSRRAPKLGEHNREILGD